MADPWFNWGWLKIGPLTTSDEERVAADRRYEELRQEEARQAAADRRDREGLPSLVPDRDASLDQFLAPPAPAQKQTPAPFPGKLDDWSVMDHIRAPFTEGGEDAYKRAREAGLDKPPAVEREQFGPNLPPGWKPPAEPAAAPAQPQLPPQETGGPTLTPQQQMIEDLKRQRELIDTLYPQRQTENPAQSAADAYSDKEMDRVNALAQLAFFSGVTQGAGGSWEGVGRGFASAGQAYGQGFDRYQRALQAKATRMAERSNQSYEDDTARTNAAIKLYEGEETRKNQRLTDARQRQKERRDAIDDFFKKRLDLSEGNDFAPTDQSMVERIMRDWRISRERGEIIDTTDVRDPAAPSS